MRITPAAPLVLGSASPRRRDMLAMLGVPFVVGAATIDESVNAGEGPAGYLDRITRTKLEAVRLGRPREGSEGMSPGSTRRSRTLRWLVADTIVVSPGGVILGKPADDDQAQAMIELFSSTTHEVSTRFVLFDDAGSEPREHAQTVTTRVTFRALAAGEARAYVESGEGRDKAGAYALQGKAAAFVERIDGSYTAVVGLPLCELVVAMRGLGWRW